MKKHYQKPDVELIDLHQQENIANSIPGGEPGNTSDPFEDD